MKGSRIKHLREDMGLTQPQLAKKLNISSSSVAMYETNKREPSDEIKLKMCKLFNCTMDYLTGRSDIRNIEDFQFAYHKETEGLSDEDIKEALRIYKQIKKNITKNNEDKKDETK